MQSPAAAFAWEFGWPRRWIPVALGVYLIAHGLLKPLLLGSGAALDLGDGYIAFATVPFAFTFMYFIAVFSFGLNGDLAARQSIYPARLFTLPVSSAALARWPMVYGLAAMSMLWVIARLAARWPLGLDLPIVNEVYRVVVDGQPASEAYRGLLRRKVGRETRSHSVR